MGKNMTRIARSKARILYKNSKTSLNTVSKNLSSTKTVSKACLQEIKKTISDTNQDSEQTKKDFCVETENCILRRFIKKNRQKLDSLASVSVNNKKVKTSKPKTKDVTVERNTKPSKLQNVQMDVPLNVERLMVNNLKTLLKIWVEKYVTEYKGGKMRRTGRSKSRPDSANLIHDLKSDVMGTSKDVECIGFTSRYSIDSSRTQLSTKCSCCSYYTIPLCGERLRIISTLSIPRHHNKNKSKSPRYLNKKHCLACKMSRRIHGKIRVQMKRSKNVAIEFSDFSVVEISKRHRLTRRKLERRVRKASVLDASVTDEQTTDDKTESNSLKKRKWPNHLSAVNSLVKSIYAEHPGNKGDGESNKPQKRIGCESPKRRTNEIQCNVLTIEEENILNNTKPLCNKATKEINIPHRKLKALPQRDDKARVIPFTQDVNAATSSELKSLIDDELSNYLKPLLKHDNVRLDIQVKMASTDNETSTNTAIITPATTLDSQRNTKPLRVERVPIIIPLLDSALTENNFLASSVAPSQNTASNQERHLRQKTIVKAELIPEISELKVVVKDLANITEDFLNKLTKRRNDSKSKYVQVTDSRLKKSENRTVPIKAHKANKVHSYHYFESETLLEVTDMTTNGSSINEQGGRLDAAITCSLPKSRSLYENPDQGKPLAASKTEGAVFHKKEKLGTLDEIFDGPDHNQKTVSGVIKKNRVIPKELELLAKAKEKAKVFKIDQTNQTKAFNALDLPAICNKCGVDTGNKASSVFIEIQPAVAGPSHKVTGKRRRLLTIGLIYGIVIGIPIIIASLFVCIEYFPKIFRPKLPKRLPLVGEFTLAELGIDHL